ncbi:5'/3'-nucleotidase SurE [Psychrobacter aestuarii]|uniref:5'-nucleotidase SurE n=1 Tax=Psychrobacter aestuarii TaxID=556327 RepID=A0ABP3FDS8_9GAMM|nr:5'/3'-nucleotidase SurE [Psychrobacter aestuarii]
MMRFLISNDDGVQAPGLLALYEALSRLGEVVVVAPDTEQSGSASALHISAPLYTHRLASGFVAVNGTPADCVYLALHELYKDTTFDCVITGINSGANMGQDVMYSGTFGAALTAQLFGVPAIATSLVGTAIDSTGQDPNGNYALAAENIARLVSNQELLATLKGLPYHVLNINVPNVATQAQIQGVRMTRLGHREILRPVHTITDPRGRDAYWLSLRKSTADAPQAMADADADTAIMSDYDAVAAGYISLSTVRLHHTSTEATRAFAALSL